MQATAEPVVMGRKKSEVRKHTAMVRIDAPTLERAKKAASLMSVSVSDYVSAMVAKNAERDILREARKLAGGGDPDR